MFEFLDHFLDTFRFCRKTKLIEEGLEWQQSLNPRSRNSRAALALINLYINYTTKQSGHAGQDGV